MFPLSLYIHIPFCARKCRYCDFYSRPYDPALADALIEAFEHEWQLVKNRLLPPGTPIATVFFGGGTPSVLSKQQWTRLAAFINALPRASDCEWTIECNPESFSNEKARQWTDAGVTRLSLGAQSLNDRELRLLGRCHSASQARTVLRSPALDRFASVSVDLMYGLPGQTAGILRSTLEKVLAYSYVNHLSAYELTIHDETPFGRHRRILPLPGEDARAGMAELITGICQAHGLFRYEVSNYARPGHECRHNQAYWAHGPYVGLGPAAHSYLGGKRLANVSDIDDYCARIATENFAREFEEELSPRMLQQEIIFLGLRTTAGIDETRFERMTGEAFASGKRKDVLCEMMRQGLILHESHYWKPTDRGIMVADGMAERLS